MEGRDHARTDPRERLRARLPEAPPDYLAGALDNEAFGVEEALLLLGNRGATREVVARVGRNRALTQSRDVKWALATHRATPYAIARSLLPHLFWRELASMSSDLRVSPVLRRDADRILATRLPELTLGERVSLARTASRGVLELLRGQADAPVLQALAGNPRLKESDLLRLLARSDAPAEWLRWLADQSSWSQRRGVRLALVRHPHTPPPCALRLTQALPSADLDALARDPSVARLVRVACDRRRASSAARADAPAS